MSNSINTNIAAYYAQANITSASNLASSSVARLSSGNRIIQASDDVAALATGTSLATNVSALKAAQSSVSQGTSLLQVADGALAQIQSILQQQKSIALQAGSGSLTDVDRGFLNQQFQALSSEIDSLAGSTTFNGVQLINGSISGQKGVTTNATAEVSGFTSNASAAALVTLATGVPVSGDTVTIQGVTATFTTNAAGTSGAVGKVVIGATIADTAANLAAFLNKSGDPHFANLYFTASGASVSANYTGGTLLGALTLTASANFATPANVTAANTTIAATTAGNLAKNPNGLTIDRFGWTGSTSGSLLIKGDTGATDFGTPLDLDLLQDNASFIGAFPTITGSYTATDTATFSVHVGNITYSTAATDITNATPTTLTFTGQDDNTGLAAGGSFKVFIAGNSITANSITSQGTLDPITAQLNSALSGVTVTQNRTVTSFQNGDIVNSGGVQVANLVGAQFTLKGSDFSNVNISSVKVTAPASGSTDAQISVVINGETYTSISGIGNQIGKNTIIALQNQSDPTKIATLVTGNTGLSGASTTTLDLGTQSKADAVQAALETAFGLGDKTASLSFQIGATAEDTLGVSIGNAKTDSIFGGQTLDVSTQAGAAAASATLDNAINTITALRSGVGALESQFGFASAALQISVQNQDAARGQLLDTDIATESTSFATQQVKLQAGISVLAQANQQLQALLKLIG